METLYNAENERARCGACAIRHRAVCGALEREELAALSRISHQRSFAAGQVIMSDQDPVDFFANVISGVVKLTKTLPDGRQQIVGLQFAPDFLGRAFSPAHTYFAEAAGDVELCCFPRNSFEALLQSSPGLEHRLFEQALQELDAAREWMVVLGRKTAQEKIASFLCLIARRSLVAPCPRGAVSAQPTFELPVSRADMADFLGLTIETVSRQITRLRTKHLIRLCDHQHFMVPDLAALNELAGHDLPALH